MQRNQPNRKSPALRAKKAAKRKAKLAVQKAKIEEKVKRRTRALDIQRAIDQNALMLASKKIAQLQLQVGTLKGELIEARTETRVAEASANGV